MSTISVTPEVEHYPSCTERAYGKAVLHLTSIGERHALTLEEIARAARAQMSHCTCAASRLDEANEKLRLARKQHRAGLVSLQLVDSVLSTRDALKAAIEVSK